MVRSGRTINLRQGYASAAYRTGLADGLTSFRLYVVSRGVRWDRLDARKVDVINNLLADEVQKDYSENRLML